MAVIVTRQGKGSPLTHAEMDANFTNLNNELDPIVDNNGDLYANQKLTFNTGNSSIEGDFYTQDLDIQSNIGNTTDVNIKSPFPNGYNSSLTVSTNNNITNYAKLWTNETSSALLANRDLGIYGQNITINTSGTDKLYIANDLTGTYTFNGTAPRILTDFSNAIWSSRLMFQTNTVNGDTSIGALPNGTATTAAYTVYNKPDPTNASNGNFLITSTEVRLASGFSGTGSFLPITFSTGLVTSVKINTDSKVGMGGAGTDSSRLLLSEFSATPDAVSLSCSPDNVAANWRHRLDCSTSNGRLLLRDSSSVNSVVLHSAGISSVRDGFVVSGPAGLGYATGAGGTVTQTTSTSTPVTLNRPCGLINLFNAAVPINGIRSFTLSNSLIGVYDGIDINVVDLGHGDTGDRWLIQKRISWNAAVITLTNIAGTTTASDFAVTFRLIKGINA